MTAQVSIRTDSRPTGRALPDFVGIAAQRAATSWMYQALSRHPQVYMPHKEVHFFDRYFENGMAWYQDLFRQVPQGTLVTGEFTPNYLTNAEAMDRLIAQLPEAKLIAVLREPMERARSAYKLMVSHGHYKGVSFSEALSPDSRLVENGLYGRYLERLLQRFPARQVRIYLHDDVLADPVAVVSDLYQWLGVDADFRPDSLENRYNVSAMARLQSWTHAPQLQNALFRSLLRPAMVGITHSPMATWLKRRLASRTARETGVEPMNPEVREIFLQDVRKLQSLIDRDLSPWRKGLQS
jgi:hypothetical protein